METPVHKIMRHKELAIAQFRSQYTGRRIIKKDTQERIEEIIELIQESQYKTAYAQMAQFFPKSHALKTLRKIIKLRSSLFPH